MCCPQRSDWLRVPVTLVFSGPREYFLGGGGGLSGRGAKLTASIWNRGNTDGRSYSVWLHDLQRNPFTFKPYIFKCSFHACKNLGQPFAPYSSGFASCGNRRWAFEEQHPLRLFVHLLNHNKGGHFNNNWG